VSEAIFCFDSPTITYLGVRIPSGVSASGGVFARTGCLTGAQGGTLCTEGDCSPAPEASPSASPVPTPIPNAQCVPGVGPGNPAVQAEFTLQRNATDYYDVTLINGANAIIQMEPIGVPTARPSAVPLDYWCQAPGAESGNKACDWNFANYINTSAVPLPPPPPIFVSPTPTPTGSPTPAPTPDPEALLIHSVRNCDTDADCPSKWSCTGTPPHGACSPNGKLDTKPLRYGNCLNDSDCTGQGGHCLPVRNGVGIPQYFCQCLSQSDCTDPDYPLCGEQLVNQPGATPLLSECGQFGGWWTADDLCAVKVSQDVGPLHCTEAISQGHKYLGATTLRLLFGCVVANSQSCYSNAATQSCCGCATDPENPDYEGTPLWDLWPSDVTGVNKTGKCHATTTCGCSRFNHGLLTSSRHAPQYIRIHTMTRAAPFSAEAQELPIL
jgi:hypothetical protein